MVRFTEDSFVIEVKVGCNPIESWLETHSDLIDSLQSEDPELLGRRTYMLELLKQMMPEWETACKMLDEPETKSHE